MVIFKTMINMDSVLKITLHLMFFSLCTLQITCAQCLVEPAIFKHKIITAENMLYPVIGNVYKDTNVILKTTCSEFMSSTCKIKIDWFLWFSSCDNGFAGYDNYKNALTLTQRYYPKSLMKEASWYNKLYVETYFPIRLRESYGNYSLCEDKNSITKTRREGRYMFLLNINSTGCKSPDIDVTVEFQKEHGYLLASNRPLLDFYGVMCAAYLILAMIWFFMFDYRCTDFQKIKMKGILGVVILVGLLEIVICFMEFRHINLVGTCSATVFYTLKIVSCLKRTSIRMLLMIVSIGYGIIKLNIKPRLHRVFQVGCCYLLLSLIEMYMNMQEETIEQELIAHIPLAILDLYIFYWIFTSVQCTIKTLRFDVVQLQLYRNFRRSLMYFIFITMIFLVQFANIVTTDCSTSCRSSWISVAYWHIFSYVQLMVIIIWWRPAYKRCTSFTDYEDQV